MPNTFAVSRAQLIYAVCLPLAVLMGYLMADPMDEGSMAVVVLVVSVLCVPVLMHWYHPLLIFAWNAAITPYFLPGRPSLWMLLSLAGLLFAVLNRISNPELRFVDVRSLNLSLLFIAAAVVFTAWARGGVGLRSFGSAHYGGRNYVWILAGVAGYFTMISRRLKPEQARFYVGLFFLSGFTAIVANLAFFGGSGLEFLYYIFPPELAQEQALEETRISGGIFRLYGLAVSSTALYCWLVSRYGLRGIFDLNKPMRGVLFLLAFGASLFSGFRSVLGLFTLSLLAQLWCEGLFRPRVLASASAALLLVGAVSLPFADRLPLTVQRTISFLPVDLNPLAKFSAQATSEWRFGMWKEVLPLIPRYLLKGKGYSYDPGELEFAVENDRRGYVSGTDATIMVGDYHSGPLSLVIPFGIWGVIGFGWFLVATLKHMYHHYRYGDPALSQINTFLLAYFIARIAHYILICGGFYSDFFVFASLAGLSVSLNGPAERKESSVELEEEVAEHEDFTPGRLRPLHPLHHMRQRL